MLIGIMGAGKSSVARELTGLSRRRWVDTDRLVIERAGGMPIAEIFAHYGEAHFRALETAALRSLAGVERLIIATGGGIVTQPENVSLLRDLGCVVWLTAEEEILFERVSRTRKRPLLRTENPRATLSELLARREPQYRACAHIAIDTSHLTHAEVAAAVFAASRAFYRSAGQDCCPPPSLAKAAINTPCCSGDKEDASTKKMAAAAEKEEKAAARAALSGAASLPSSASAAIRPAA